MKYSRLRRLAHLFFPPNYTCDICGIEIFEGNLCKDCLKTVTFNNDATCPVCGRKTVLPQICLECKSRLPLFKKAVSPLVYGGGASMLIAKYKRGDNGYLKEFFADLIFDKLKDFPEFDCIVCVPMTKKAERARGYNQSALLAKAVSRRTEKPFIKDCIIKIKDTSEQKNLSRREREKNLASCFKLNKRKEIKGKSLLLIDDVLTTGATADAICKLLLSAGAKNVFLATVCSVQLESNAVKTVSVPLFNK